MIIPSTSIAFSKFIIFDGTAGPETFQGRLNDPFFTGGSRRNAGRRQMDAGALRAGVPR